MKFIMDKPLKIKVDFDNKTTKALLNFITDTQEGKYTEKKPDLTQITYKRFELQEQDTNNSIDDCSEEVILLGISS